MPGVCFLQFIIFKLFRNSDQAAYQKKHMTRFTITTAAARDVQA